MNEINLLEAYLDGSLKGEPRKAFERRLEQEPALQQELADYRRLLNGFEALHEDSPISRVKRWQEKAQTREANTSRSLPLKAISIAAASIVFLCFGIWWMLNSQPMLEQHLIADTYSVLAVDDKKRGRNDFRIIDDALSAAAKENFEESIEQLEDVLPNDSLYLLARVLKGATHINNKKASLAIQALESVLAAPNLTTDEEVKNKINSIRWLLVQAYLLQYLEDSTKENKTELQNQLEDLLEKNTDTVIERKAKALKEDLV